MSSPGTPAPATTTVTCPGCQQQTSGRFCSHCGTALEGAACNACRAPLTPGAKFCHRCGTAAGALAGAAGAARSAASAMPWAVAAIALLVLVAWGAGQRFNARSASALDAPSNAVFQPGLDDGSPNAPFAGVGQAAGGMPAGAEGAPGEERAARAPDISNMSPDERATRLFNRVMRLSEEKKQDSVQVFATMAILAHEQLPAQTTDTRYHLARIAEASGVLDVAAAHADTILARSPNHLLALALRARISPSAADRATLNRRLLAATGAQGNAFPEYEHHAVEIDSAVARARRRQ